MRQLARMQTYAEFRKCYVYRHDVIKPQPETDMIVLGPVLKTAIEKSPITPNRRFNVLIKG